MFSGPGSARALPDRYLLHGCFSFCFGRHRIATIASSRLNCPVRRLLSGVVNYYRIELRATRKPRLPPARPPKSPFR
jgi:hypothetical protein